MTAVADLVGRVLQDVVGTVRADWPYLLASILAPRRCVVTSERTGSSGS